VSPDSDGKQPVFARAGEDDGSCSDGPRLEGRSAVADFVRSLPEEFAGWMLAVYLDRDFSLLALDRVGPETQEKYRLKPMEFVRRGHKLGAVGFVLVHYAPDRTTKAWPGELRMSREIRRAGEDFDIHLLDHLVIGRDRLFEVDP
jgi:DNA repair protein RadC